MDDRLDFLLNSVYRFRFLNRYHFQSFLNHKNHRLIIVWLNTLTSQGFLKRYYNPHNVTDPAIYSLGNKGRKYIKENLGKPVFKDIKEILLDRIWRKHSLQFKKHCMLVADIYLSLINLTRKTGAILNFKTQTDLYGMKYLILDYPDVFFSIKEKNGMKKYFFLDIFDDWPARSALKKRIRQYFEYYDNGYWQDHAKVDFPCIILVAPEEQSKNYLLRKIQEKLEDNSELNFYLTTRNELKTKGLVGDALRKVEARDAS